MALICLSRVFRARQRLVVPHQEFGVLLKDVLRKLLRDRDNGLVILVLPGSLKSGTYSFDAEDLDAFMRRCTVFLELPQQRALPHLIQVIRLVQIWDIPTVFSLGAEAGMVLGQIAQFFEVGGEIAVDLAWNLAVTVIAQEVLLEKFREFQGPLVFLPAADL